MNCAIADLGSNTIRLSVYQIRPDGSFERLFSEKETAGLAGYIDGGVMSGAGLERACQALRRFRTLLRQCGIESLSVFATAPLRNIRNTAEAVETIRRETGLDVEVLSGEQEGRLSYLGAMETQALRSGVLFDLGGGSTELAEVRDGALLRVRSLPLGSLNLFTRYVSQIWPRRGEIEAMREAAARALARADLPAEKAERVCGVGGTARAVLKIANAWYGRPASERHFMPEELSELTGLLLRRDKTARGLILRACPDRLHTILPGILLMNAVCGKLCRGDIWISQSGVREGYLCHRLMGKKI